jgi:hypothetical protein
MLIEMGAQIPTACSVPRPKHQLTSSILKLAVGLDAQVVILHNLGIDP